MGNHGSQIMWQFKVDFFYQLIIIKTLNSVKIVTQSVFVFKLFDIKCKL